jgi:predicted dehydrogenase
VRIVVIGAGSIGRRHFNNLTFLGVDVVCVPYRAYRPDILEGCDGVVIATATDVRLRLILDAAERKLPMYVEKPLAYRLDDLTRIGQLTEPVANRSVLGFMMRYHPAFRTLADMDLSGAFRFACHVGYDVGKWRENWTYSNSYAAKPEGGGVLLDLCHEIDMASVLFPDIMLKSVSSMGHSNYPGVDVSSCVTVQTELGVEGTINMDYLTPQLHRRILVYGIGAMYDFDFSAQRYEVKDKNGGRVFNLPFERNDMFIDITRDWLALLQGHEISNPYVPRLDRLGVSTSLIASAWEARQFTGRINKEL